MVKVSYSEHIFKRNTIFLFIGIVFLTGCLANRSKRIPRNASRVSVVNVLNEPIKHAKVILVDEEGKRHKAKQVDRYTYAFKQRFSKGTLIVSHSRYNKVAYNLDKFPDGMTSLTVSLWTNKEGVHKQGGIHYPFIPQLNRIGIVSKSGTDYWEVREYFKDKLTQFDIQNGDYIKRKKRKKYRSIELGEVQHTAAIYNIEKTSREKQKACLIYLDSLNREFEFGPLLGPHYILSTQFYASSNEKISKDSIIKALANLDTNIKVVNENKEHGIFTLQYLSFSTEEILEVIEKVKTLDLFHTVVPHLVGTTNGVLLH